MRTLTLALNDEMAALLERDKPLDQAAFEALVLDLYQSKKISSGKACEMLGVDRVEFLRRANAHNIPVYLTNEEEWEREKAATDSWLRS